MLCVLWLWVLLFLTHFIIIFYSWAYLIWTELSEINVIWFDLIISFPETRTILFKNNNFFDKCKIVTLFLFAKHYIGIKTFLRKTGKIRLIKTVTKSNKSRTLLRSSKNTLLFRSNFFIKHGTQTPRTTVVLHV